jgi:hypothetical protein
METAKLSQFQSARNETLNSLRNYMDKDEGDWLENWRDKAKLGYEGKIADYIGQVREAQEKQQELLQTPIEAMASYDTLTKGLKKGAKGIDKALNKISEKVDAYKMRAEGRSPSGYKFGERGLAEETAGVELDEGIRDEDTIGETGRPLPESEMGVAPTEASNTTIITDVEPTEGYGEVSLRINPKKVIAGEDKTPLKSFENDAISYNEKIAQQQAENTQNWLNESQDWANKYGSKALQEEVADTKVGDATSEMNLTADLDETSALEGTAVKETATEGILGATAGEEGLVEGLVGAGAEALGPLAVAGLTGLMIYDLIDPPKTPSKPPPPPTQTTIPSNIVNKYNLDKAILPTADAVVDSHSQLSPF